VGPVGPNERAGGGGRVETRHASPSLVSPSFRLSPHPSSAFPHRLHLITITESEKGRECERGREREGGRRGARVSCSPTPHASNPSRIRGVRRVAGGPAVPGKARSPPSYLLPYLTAAWSSPAGAAIRGRRVRGLSIAVAVGFDSGSGSSGVCFFAENSGPSCGRCRACLLVLGDLGAVVVVVVAVSWLGVVWWEFGGSGRRNSERFRRLAPYTVAGLLCSSSALGEAFLRGDFRWFRHLTIL
jgi:hypothetical protein